MNSKKTALLPKLRFPEFRKATGWVDKPLFSAARITQGGTPSTNISAYWGGNVHWVTPAEMGKSVNPYISSTMRTLTEDGLKNCSSDLLPEMSIILSTRAPIGHLAINTVPMAINQGCRGIVAKPDFYGKFIFYSIDHNKLKLINLGAGNTFKELSGSALKLFSISFPSFKEQQKIADCLSSLDELIEAQSQKLELLKAHKKALMQQLFCRGGGATPRLRFPTYRHLRPWRAHKMGDIAPLQRGVDLPSSRLKNGNIPVVYSNGIQNFHNKNIAEAPGIVTGRSGTIGKFHFIESGPYWPHNTTLWVTDFKGNVPKFVYYLLKNIGIQRFVAGSGVPTLNRNDVHEFLSHLPPLKEEQQKIAACLSTMDELIDLQTEKTNALKTHKTALMQQLFPLN